MKKRWLLVLLAAFILLLIPTPVRATTPIDHYEVPQGFSINPATGQVNWLPQPGQEGIWHIKITAQDNGSPVMSDSKELTISVYAASDVNQDWNIDLLDLILVGQHFGDTGGQCDVNHDGKVDVLDFIIVVKNIGVYV